MRSGRLKWLPLALSLFACGGRFEQTAGNDGGGSGAATTTQAGASGTSTRGGTSTRAGSSSGGAEPSGTGGVAPTGGAVSAGTSSSAGMVCDCAEIGCPAGYTAVPSASGCCYDCAPIAPDVCETQRQSYATYKLPLMQKYETLGCVTNADCAIFYDQSRCVTSSCGEPLPQSAIPQVTQALASISQMVCTALCPPLPVPACDPLLGITCIDHRCGVVK